MDIVCNGENIFVCYCLCSASFFSSLLRTRYVHVIRCLSRLKSESIIFDAPDCSEESKDEEGPSNKIEDSIEDHLVVYCENVATL